MVVDVSTGMPLPAGQMGEFIFKGPSSCRGYYDAEERNREAFTADGFCRSGDLMKIHDIGGARYISFEGRLKDVVSRGGEKVNCQEVEQALIDHPGVGAIAIVPMPDPVLGEKACAFIIASRGAAAPTVQEAGAFLATRGLARFKWPERIEVVKEFPTTSSGKVSKPRLRELIEATVNRELGQGC
jgi:non-ribosomal peptide synthetase component E (peptide arylation enzyme)